jgi:hypothetical protein
MPAVGIVGVVSREAMVGFGYKNAWLAIRDGEPQKVIGALGLRDLGLVPWRNAADLAYLTDDRLLVTPPLPGAASAHWVLVAGRWLLGGQASVDVPRLSTLLHTEVQAFATHRTIELHSWQRAVGGTLVRAFQYLGESGEVEEWWGEPDQTELSVGLPPAIEESMTVLVGEHDVMRVAGGWSIDPSSLDGRPAPGLPRAAAAD